jgi:uncharacterized protein YjiS (DUF1127 family)
MHAIVQRRYVLPMLRRHATPALWLRRIVTRSRLRELDARLLEDIGCSEEERQRECAKWFWQA